MDMGSVGSSGEVDGRGVGWRPVHVDRLERSLWHVQGSAGSDTDVSRYVKRYTAVDPYERELRALQQMPEGLAPRVIEHRRDPPTLVLEELPGVRLDDPAAGDPAGWMQEVLKTVVASVGLPGPWPDDPSPKLSQLQAEVAATLASRAPASTRALHRALEDPLRVPCHACRSRPVTGVVVGLRVLRPRRSAA
jgi:hypothetical protein